MAASRVFGTDRCGCANGQKSPEMTGSVAMGVAITFGSSRAEPTHSAQVSRGHSSCFDNLSRAKVQLRRSGRLPRREVQARRRAPDDLLRAKDTVRGTLAPVLAHHEVPFRVMHGFASATTVQEIAAGSLTSERPLVALYVGDWDPSGLHMSEEDLASASSIQRRSKTSDGSRRRPPRLSGSPSRRVTLPMLSSPPSTSPPRPVTHASAGSSSATAGRTTAACVGSCGRCRRAKGRKTSRILVRSWLGWGVR